MEGMGEEAKVEVADEEVPEEFCWASLTATPVPIPLLPAAAVDTETQEDVRKAPKELSHLEELVPRPPPP